MQIPIAARRYIAELELSDREWLEDVWPIDCGDGGALVICGHDNDFSIFHAFDHQGEWVTFDPNTGASLAIESSVICWSEIKA